MEKWKKTTNPVRLWSFDGGGSNIISQLILVNEIMHQIQWIRKLEQVPRQCEFADLMMGTGRGAVVALLLARLLLTAEEALQHVCELGQSVFLDIGEPPDGTQFNVTLLANSVKKILTLCGLNEDARMIADIAASGETYAAVTTVLASDLSTCQLLRTYRTPSPDYNCTIVEAILASVALPEWFPAARVGPAHYKETLVSGSIGYNNPTKKMLSEAGRIFGPDRPVSIILSFGAGQALLTSLNDNTLDAVQKTHVVMALEGANIADDLEERFTNYPAYNRFSVDAGAEMVSIAGWNQEQLGLIITHTKRYIKTMSSAVESVVGLLLENDGSQTISQLSYINSKQMMTKCVPRLSPYYIPQDEFYEFMDQRLVRDHWDTQKIFVVHGMGGVGKTQATSFFRRRNRHRYKNIFYIDACSVTNIKADLQSAVRSLGGSHSQDTFEDALRYLANNDGWLVIFDNADDPNLRLQKYMPHCDHGTLMIAGRTPELAHLAPESHWELRGLANGSALRVLLGATHLPAPADEQDSTAARELCEALGGLPLALVHAGCYCRQLGFSFTQYLKRFNEHRAILMSKKPRLHLDDYLYSTYASIRLSYSQLDDSSRVLLHLFCLLHASNISLKIFKTAAKYQYRSRAEWEILPRDEKHAERLGILQKMFISDGKWATVHVDELLIHLKSFSLASLSCSKGTRTITIHPLVQSCIRDTLPKEELEYYLHMAMQVLNSCSRPEEAPLIQELTSHTAVLESIGVDMHANDIAAIGYIIFANGGFEGAIEKWEQVRRECQRQIGDEASLTLRVSHWIGDSLRRIHRYKEAEELVRGVAEAQKRTLGETDRETLWSHELLGRILSNQFKTEEAEAIFRRVLALDEKVFGKENCRTLSIHISLAVVSARQGKYAEAEEIIKHILPVIKANLGEKDVLTLDTSRKLAGILIRQEKWEEAKAIAEEFVEKSQEVYGKTHTNTLNYSACLAVSLRGSGNYKEAERIQKEVLPVQEKKLGPNHADTVKTRDQLETTSRMIEQMDKKGNLTAIPEDPASDLSDAPNLPHLHLSLSTRLRPVVSTGAISPAIPTHSPFGFDYLLNRSQRGSRSSSSTHTGSHGSPRPTPGQLKRFWTVLTSRRR